MQVWAAIILTLHVLIALAIIGLVLLQHGKGADMGSGFGGGSSTSLFGATGSANFLSRTTAILATVFFVTSMALAFFASHREGPSGGVMDGLKDEAPAAKSVDKAVQPPAPAPSIPDPAKAKDVPN